MSLTRAMAAWVWCSIWVAGFNLLVVKVVRGREVGGFIEERE